MSNWVGVIKNSLYEYWFLSSVATTASRESEACPYTSVHELPTSSLETYLKALDVLKEDHARLVPEDVQQVQDEEQALCARVSRTLLFPRAGVWLAGRRHQEHVATQALKVVDAHGLNVALTVFYVFIGIRPPPSSVALDTWLGVWLGKLCL